MYNINNIPIYSVYNDNDEILFIGTRAEIKKYFDVCSDTIYRWIKGKTKKYRCYLVGYSGDNLEDDL